MQVSSEQNDDDAVLNRKRQGSTRRLSSPSLSLSLSLSLSHARAAPTLSFLPLGGLRRSMTCACFHPGPCPSPLGGSLQVPTGHTSMLNPTASVAAPVAVPVPVATKGNERIEWIFSGCTRNCNGLSSEHAGGLPEPQREVAITHGDEPRAFTSRYT
ncbi:uncharacterized protein K489DRAFT_113849 [Dissoconium aciculare CBS 342.82]|uniref:Uncharacterized protein n=1 Tax=Dissoconium aciculare CBS 342.82 TaxID=1314786 RepID=A0A6J3MFD5_9PEZI|nr:uncharacterized protein K489DRAFT_113849 [Dissoconium aciculare CBS 342.82]KAF1826364.1 hypothetical protein K489DRAFT_113849 [Dissoconium aciculare CBS 342.82]